jgi:hypothetical protein
MYMTAHDVRENVRDTASFRPEITRIETGVNRCGSRLGFGPEGRCVTNGL